MNVSNYFYVQKTIFAAQTALSLFRNEERKVRTPKSSIAGNARPLKGEDKCNRKYVQVML